MRGELCAIGKLLLCGTRIVVPKELRSHVLELAHEGHPGIMAMKQQLRSKVWWPGLDKDAERVCKTCHGCQLVSQPLKPEPMARTEFPSAPWQHLAADLLGPLPSGNYRIYSYISRPFLTKKSAQKIALDLYTSHIERSDQAVREISITTA